MGNKYKYDGYFNDDANNRLATEYQINKLTEEFRIAVRDAKYNNSYLDIVDTDPDTVIDLYNKHIDKIYMEVFLNGIRFSELNGRTNIPTVTIARDIVFATLPVDVKVDNIVTMAIAHIETQNYYTVRYIDIETPSITGIFAKMNNKLYTVISDHLMRVNSDRDDKSICTLYIIKNAFVSDVIKKIKNNYL